MTLKFSTIVNGEGSDYPWTRNTGNIKIEKFKTRSFSAIGIVEDFPLSDPRYRFYCEMTGLVFDNLEDKATSNTKAKVTEPTCKCVKQEWNGEWENKGEPKECGIGPKSFIQSL